MSGTCLGQRRATSGRVMTHQRWSDGAGYLPMGATVISEAGNGVVLQVWFDGDPVSHFFGTPSLN